MIVFLEKSKISNADLEWIEEKINKNSEVITLVDVKKEFYLTDTLELAVNMFKLKEDKPVLGIVLYQEYKEKEKDKNIILKYLIDYLDDRKKENKALSSHNLYTFIEDVETLNGIINNYLNVENLYFIDKSLRVFLFDFFIKVTKLFIDNLGEKELKTESIAYSLAWNKYTTNFSMEQKNLLERIKNKVKGYSTVARIYYKYSSLPGKIRVLYFVVKGLTIEDLIKLFGSLKNILEEDELDEVIDILSVYKKEDIDTVKDKVEKLMYLNKLIRHIPYKDALEEIERQIDNPKGIEILNVKFSLIEALNKADVNIKECLGKINEMLNNCGLEN